MEGGQCASSAAREGRDVPRRIMEVSHRERGRCKRILTPGSAKGTSLLRKELLILKHYLQGKKGN